MRFLSDEWFDAMAAALTGVEVPAEVALRVGQVVTGAPEGDVAYVIDCRDGRCTISRSGVDGADVVFTSEVSVARQLADGRSQMAAGHAVLRGDVVVSGDVTALLAVGDLPARLGEAVGKIALSTDD